MVAAGSFTSYLSPWNLLDLLMLGFIAAVVALRATGDPTPRDRAKALCSTGTVAAGSAAHVVLETGVPWGRQTHRFYPPEVRARVVKLVLLGELLSRDARFNAYGPQAVVDAFEAHVIPHAVSSRAWR